MSKNEYQRCTNCVMDTTDPQITFDANGVCDHCRNFYQNILPSWHEGEEGKKELIRLVETIKREGRGKRYDCIIGLSGGIDSSYAAYYCREVLGLRPLLFVCDTGWNLDVAEHNINAIVEGLGCELYTEKVNWEEIRDLQLAFFKSQVPYQDLVQDHVIFASLYNFAVKHKIKYVVTGANYSTECVREPQGWVYQNDLTMIRDIHARFGKRKLDTLPMCSMFKYRLYYRYIKGMQVVRPLNLIEYRKDSAIQTLNEQFGWQPYANKHYESIFTRFYEGYWLPHKFGYDKRKCYYSSLILTGQMERMEAIELLEQPPYSLGQAMEDMRYIADKLGISTDEFKALMHMPNKTYKDYKNASGLISLGVKAAKFLGVEKRNFR